MRTTLLHLFCLGWGVIRPSASPSVTPRIASSSNSAEYAARDQRCMASLSTHSRSKQINVLCRTEKYQNFLLMKAISASMGVRNNFSRVNNVYILSIVFRCLPIQCKWMFIKRFTRYTLQRKCPLLQQLSRK